MVKRIARLLFSLLFIAVVSLPLGGSEAFADEPTPVDKAVVQAADQAAGQLPSQAREPKSVVVATDAEDQADARAVAEQLLELQAEQGGSIVPPASSWPFNLENPPKASLAPVPQQGWSHPTLTGEVHPGWGGRNVWEFRLQRQGAPGNRWPTQQAAWNQAQQRQSPSPAEVLRDSAWQLEVTAQRLEVGEFYEQADAVRQAAQHLRLEGRKQAKRDGGGAAKRKSAKQHRAEASREKRQKPEQHNPQNWDKPVEGHFSPYGSR